MSYGQPPDSDTDSEMVLTMTVTTPMKRQQCFFDEPFATPVKTIVACPSRDTEGSVAHGLSPHCCKGTGGGRSMDGTPARGRGGSCCGLPGNGRRRVAKGIWFRGHQEPKGLFAQTLFRIRRAKLLEARQPAQRESGGADPERRAQLRQARQAKAAKRSAQSASA